MLSVLETHRRLYNNALAQRRDAYRLEKRSVSYSEQNKQLTADRKTNPFLALVNCAASQRTLRRLDKAFAAFFRRVKAGEKKCGYPRFKGEGRFDSIEYRAGNGARLATWGKAYFQEVGVITIKQDRVIEGIVKAITFKREADHWYVLFICDVELPDPSPSINPTVGIDLGLKSFLVTSDGQEIASPKLYRHAEKRLQRLQRQLSRKKKGSMNRRKAVLKVARLHRHIANQRRDFRHKTARDLVNRYGGIAYEQLNIKGMMRSRFAKSVQDAGWSGFLFLLNSKAVEAGVQVIEVDARYTTQTCSACGSLPSESIGLGVRTYFCCHCGYTADRDVNAAVNIKNRAFPDEAFL